MTIQWAHQLNHPQVEVEYDNVKFLEAIKIQLREAEKDIQKLHTGRNKNFILCIRNLKELSLVLKSENFMAGKLADICLEH
ncbi:hypothetical protein MKX01_042494 [Papaver californicum]|nr:hypothetical protein MKX01_041290 [Papaver californicum]KAI3930948.1 hypothetical protein MKX01_042494 [Papaver californicum]